MSIKDFLAKKPSLGEIADFIETEARRIAAEKKASEFEKYEC